MRYAGSWISNGLEDHGDHIHKLTKFAITQIRQQEINMKSPKSLKLYSVVVSWSLVNRRSVGEVWMSCCTEGWKMGGDVIFLPCIMVVADFWGFLGCIRMNLLDMGVLSPNLQMQWHSNTNSQRHCIVGISLNLIKGPIFVLQMIQ